MMTFDQGSLALCLKKSALECGIRMPFITSLNLPEETVLRFDIAVEHSPMKSLKARRNERLMFTPVMKDAQSMLIGIVPYPAAPESKHIATYALFETYQDVILKKLSSVTAKVVTDFPGIGFYPFVDMMPVAEKSFAKKVGIGFTGRNTLITNREFGSRFFICGLLVSCALPEDPTHPVSDDGICDKCRKCEVVCPTGALCDRKLDVGKCLAWHTIEYKGTTVTGKDIVANENVFGCGLCEKICPFNKEKPDIVCESWKTRYDLASAGILELKKMAETDFRAFFGRTPIERTGRERFLRNIERCLQDK